MSDFVPVGKGTSYQIKDDTFHLRANDEENPHDGWGVTYTMPQDLSAETIEAFRMEPSSGAGYCLSRGGVLELYGRLLTAVECIAPEDRELGNILFVCLQFGLVTIAEQSLAIQKAVEAYIATQPVEDAALSMAENGEKLEKVLQAAAQVSTRRTARLRTALANAARESHLIRLFEAKEEAEFDHLFEEENPNDE